ncbi:DNA gyrase subunit A [Anoxynatronum buryatiense]|uniref:DNA gyrase subunit A n=1 Tax=Anoxynatronum buryatiense TaxID=489973 RepID=A0AA45WW96_9CLOT|nr:DNA gyrase subunit A [Anoxynatronum buryatiense]SMP58324.1 DNA gyrase subunit A [Anoxynatronum buryatiense]
MDQELQKIIPIGIEDEMKKSYIDYAMSVIVGRALPDVRDGFKPVHRRILYAMNDLGMGPDKPYRKSARIVGDVLGKYHPHGDSAVYLAMVRMAQDFSIRAPLVDGHGNFGSVDGDSPAAMRYTEARLSKIAVEMLRDIGKETVDFMPNFDETLQEPVVLPSRFPNLLVNGSSGIAVGMATNIPPHNLGEVIDGAVLMLEEPDISLEKLMTTIPAPDFPTGGTILGRSGILAAYRTGRGRVRVRAKAEIEQLKSGKAQIIVTELPYQVNKARLIEKIAHLVRDKKMDGITDLRDESDRDGMRIVIELRRDVSPNVVLNRLYKHSQMEESFGVIMLALVDGQPKVLNLKEMLHYYLEHQKEIIVRRTRYDLAKAEEKAHILEGLRKALDHLDQVIALIRGSRTGAEAKEGLMTQFDFSERQAQAILDMRLQRLTGLERDKIIADYEETMKVIQQLRAILASEQMVRDIIRDELVEIKEKYGDPRRTLIEENIEELNMEDFIEEEDVVITMTHFGYCKRVPVSEYKSQKRGGKGISALSTREEDFVERILITSSHDSLLFFTNRGRVYKLNVYEIPEGKRQAKGSAIVNLIQLEPEEKITATIPVSKQCDLKYLLMATEKGVIKKTQLCQFLNTRKRGLIALTLREGDQLISVRHADPGHHVMLTTARGIGIRFETDKLRETGRSSMGVKGITLAKDDRVVTMEVFDPQQPEDLLVVSEKGFGKRTSVNQYRVQSRGGKGLYTYNYTEDTGELIGARITNDDDELLLINQDGSIIRLAVTTISRVGRRTRGVRLMRTGEQHHIISMALLPRREEEPENALEEDLETEVETEATHGTDLETAEDENEMALNEESEIEIDTVSEEIETEDEE